MEIAFVIKFPAPVIILGRESSGRDFQIKEHEVWEVSQKIIEFDKMLGLLRKDRHNLKVWKKFHVEMVKRMRNNFMLNSPEN